MKQCSYCGDDHLFLEEMYDGKLICPGCKVCAFFEKYLTLTGDYAGQAFTLMPWTRDVLRDLFGTLDEDGRRRYRDAYLEIPKKNTKTTLCAGLVVYCLSTSTTTGTEVYSAATSKDQSAIVYRAAEQMVKHSRPLARRIKCLPSTKRMIRRDDPTSFYAAISADGDIHDGINPSFVVRDELHRWRTRKCFELNEVLERGTISREEPLVVDITTAGEPDESPLCWRRHEYAKQIIDGVITDRRFYGRIWSADLSKHPWDSKEARVQANPSHEDNGGYLKDEVLEDMCLKAQNDFQIRADYQRYHLNIWGQKDNRAIDILKWDACPRPWRAEGLLTKTAAQGKVRALPPALMKHFIERRCWAGVDLSLTTDMSAVTFVFPFDDGSGYDVLPFFWMPEETIKAREAKDHVPYQQWAAMGFLELCPGTRIDYRDVKARLKWGAEMFDLREICFDPWNSRELSVSLVDEGYKAVEIRQGYFTLSEPSKKLLELITAGKLRHGGHPVLRWNASCVTAVSQNDNMMFAKPDRNRDAKRIDGISATVNALRQALLLSNPKQSVYATRGLLEI